MTPPTGREHHPELDVYSLPSSGLDASHPIWWGNTLLLAVESTIFTLLVISYFYLRKNFDPWPPPRATIGLIQDPRPALGAATADLCVILASCVPMMWLDRTARRRERLEVEAEEIARPPAPEHGGQLPRTLSPFLIGLLVTSAMGIACIALRFAEFPGLRFAWRANAYASVIWSLLVLHLTYLVMSVVEMLLLAIWVWQRGLTGKFALDTTLAAVSWYWTAGVWVVAYAVVYWAPRLL